MAQLNCPSCHHHGLVWDWNQSHLMAGGLAPAWGGLPTGTWHGSAMLPPYRPSDEMMRRNSLRVQPPPRRSRRDLTTDDEDDSHHRRNISPVRSRRGPVSDDSEDEVISHRGGRRHRRRTSPASRNTSPALSRRSSRKKSSVGVEELIARRAKQNEEESLRTVRRYDDDTISNRGSKRYDDETISNRGGRRYDDETVTNRGRRRYEDETMSNRGGRRYDDDRLSIKSGKRHDIDDSLSNRGRRSDFEDSLSNKSLQLDDEVISNREARRYDLDETTSNRGSRKEAKRRKHRSSPTQSKISPAMSRKFVRNISSEDSGDEMSDTMKRSSPITKVLNKGGKIEKSDDGEPGEDVNFPSDVDKPLGPVPTQEWECEHCTFVNQAGSRVCIVCCKTTNNPKYKHQNKGVSKQQINREHKSQEDKKNPKSQNSSTSPQQDHVAQAQEKWTDKNMKEGIQIKSPVEHQSSKESETCDGPLAEKMKQLVMTSAADKKKGRKRRSISFWLGTKLYS